MTDPIRWFSETDVRELIALPDVIDGLTDMLARAHLGQAANVAKAMAAVDGSSIHSLGSYDTGRGVAAFKNWINTPRGAQAVLTLFDLDAGRVLAVIEAGILGALRTAAATAVGTRQLAPADASSLALVGSGRQAYLQLAAVLAVRPITKVRVWSPTTANRELFAQRASAMFGVNVVPSDSLAYAVNDAEIVTTVTRATEPFLKMEHVSPSVHLNAVGAILPGAAEIHPELMAAANAIVVDDLRTADLVSLELANARALDPTLDTRVNELADAVADDRPRAAGITIFKALGMGMSDLAAAVVLWDLGRTIDVGTHIPPSSPGLPRWHRTTQEDNQ